MLDDTQLQLLTDAMARHQPIEIAYRDKKGNRTERVVTPQSITADNRNLSAWCHSRDALRHFRLERIEAISEAVGQPVVVDGEDGQPPLLELPEVVVAEWFEVRVNSEKLPQALIDGPVYANSGGWLAYSEGWVSGEGHFDGVQAAQMLTELCEALETEMVLCLERDDRLPGFKLLLTPQGPAREDGHRVRLSSAQPAAA
jgi:hypothetical protein